mgnify:CR=1 FL=1
MNGDDWVLETLDPLQRRPAWADRDGESACARFLRAGRPLPEPHVDSPDLPARAVADAGRLLYLAGAGPDAGCDRLVVDAVTHADGELSVDARVESEPGISAQVITYPASLLWVPGVDADRATATITDGWRRVHTVAALANE